jgi:glucose/arabinose dehydrogenase
MFTLIPVGVCGQTLPLDKIQLPAGFQINLFSGGVPGARSLTISPSGILFVGTRDEGKVYGLVDQNKDGTADRVYTLAKGLDQPNGVAFLNGSLYVAEISRILRFDGIEGRLENPPQPVVVKNDLPKEGHHGWKFIAFGPDKKLYVPVGAPCNICEKPDPFESITRMNPDGSGFEVFARGVRNTVGFAWEPNTGVLWFTDNGRDWLGDDLPPDELNRAPQREGHFGFPYCYGDNVPDPQFKKSPEECAQYIPPALKLPAHVAALGMRFYTGKMFPEKYRNQIFIAEHGSWNRAQKIGYQVIWAQVQDGKIISAEPFATGWLQGQSTWGRPVDVQIMPDGALLVSDDYAGAIYRIGYKTP